MASCVIFCAGEFDGTAPERKPGDYIIAADGGLRHTQALGLAADAVLGDFDSLGFAPEGANVFPVEKDDTDAMLAIRRGLELGYREFLLYGALEGPRLDHTLANCQSLLFLAQRGARGYLMGKNTIVTAIRNGSIRFPAGCSGTVSVFCLGADARGVTLEGLHYPLRDHVLTADFPLGVSNHFTGQEAVVTVGDGCLLILWDRENGLPEEGGLETGEKLC